MDRRLSVGLSEPRRRAFQLLPYNLNPIVGSTPARVTIANRAIGGRSSRTVVSEGGWERLIAEVEEGDFVLIQFGHNDGGPIDTPPARGSLPGLGEATHEIVHPTTKAKETVLTFGAYLRNFVAEIRERGAGPRSPTSATVFKTCFSHKRHEIHKSRGLICASLWPISVVRIRSHSFVHSEG